MGLWEESVAELQRRENNALEKGEILSRVVDEESSERTCLSPSQATFFNTPSTKVAPLRTLGMSLYPLSFLQCF